MRQCDGEGERGVKDKALSVMAAYASSTARRGLPRRSPLVRTRSRENDIPPSSEWVSICALLISRGEIRYLWIDGVHAMCRLHYKRNPIF